MAMHVVGLLDAINKIAIYYLKPLLFIDMDDFTFSVYRRNVFISKRKGENLSFVCLPLYGMMCKNLIRLISIDSQVLTMIIINREEQGGNHIFCNSVSLHRCP